MLSEENVKTNSPRAWLLAARPKTLSGAAVPVMLGTALAFKNTGWPDFHVLPAVLCFLFAFLMQIDSNFINDYFDFMKGNDDPASRLGPRRACAEGWITPAAMRIGLAVTSSLACSIGLPLVYYGGWEMIIVGAICVLFAFFYTTFFSYLGLGDLLVLVFFGIVPVCFTCYVIMPAATQTITLETFLLSIACGCIIDTLLCINNFRDRDNDRRDGKRTLIVRLGERWGTRLYAIMGYAGAAIAFLTLWVSDCFISPVIGPLPGLVYAGALLVIYVNHHTKTYQNMKAINHGRALNGVLGQTARNMFLFGLLTSAEVLIFAFLQP